jgi:hypothetical protein
MGKLVACRVPSPVSSAAAYRAIIRRMRTGLLRVARVLGRVVFALAWLWCIGALWYLCPGPRWVGVIASVAFALGIPILWRGLPHVRRRIVVLFCAVMALLVLLLFLERPSTERAWVADMRAPARVEIDGDRVRIENVRDCSYRTQDECVLRLLDETYDLRALITVDFLVERFHSLDVLAHTLLSFGFSDGRYVAISVELRREEGESFHPVAGIYRQFELLYVIGTEQDLIGLRTNYRKSRAWLYPIRTTPARMRALFLDMLRRSQQLLREPEFYDSLTNSCTTNIVEHVRLLYPGRIPLDWRVVFPGYAGELALELDLVDTDLPPARALEAFRIDQVAQQGPVDAAFSRRIRSARPRDD